MHTLVTSLLDATVACASVLIAATGFYLVYVVLRVYNMAHGELMMVGAYSAVVVSERGSSFAVALVAGTLAAAAVGVVLHLAVIRKLQGRHDLSTLLATWGAGLVLSEACRWVFGPGGRAVDVPIRGTVDLLGTILPAYNVAVTIAAVVVWAIVAAIWRFSGLGRLVRATVDNRVTAEQLGIHTGIVFGGCMFLGAGLAGFAGALLAPTSAITPSMGPALTLTCVLAVLVGGRVFSSPVIGGAVVGGFRALVAAWAPVTVATFAMLALVVIVLWADAKRTSAGGQQ